MILFVYGVIKSILMKNIIKKCGGVLQKNGGQRNKNNFIMIIIAKDKEKICSQFLLIMYHLKRE